MGHYPISLDLDGKLCLVVGGGRVSERKVCSLLAYGAAVRLVGPELTPQLNRFVDQDKVVYRQGQYQTSDLAGVFLVICATDSKEINRRVAEDCVARDLLVNVVDQPDKCNFFVPAVVQRGDLSIAVSTGGKSPLLARKIREELEQSYGEQYGEYLDLLAGLRREVIRQMPDEDKKREILDKMVSGDMLTLLRGNRMDQIKERLNSAYRGGGT